MKTNEPEINLKLRKKLEKMAGALPEYIIDDLELLNSLLTQDDLVRYEVSNTLFSKIETRGINCLSNLGEIILENSLQNIAEELIHYSLEQGVFYADDAQNGKTILGIVIDAITQFYLVDYLDIERQSDRIRLFYQHHEFSVNITELGQRKRLELLQLLHDHYVRTLTQPPHALPANQGINIEKYNNIVRLIILHGKANREDLENASWGALYILDSLEYDPDRSKALFGPKAPSSGFIYDEMLWRYFNILLIPAFGSIRVEKNRIFVVVEGKGSLRNPVLEICLNNEASIEITTNDEILPGKSAIFELDRVYLRRLSVLDPNIREITIRLHFEKFSNARFVLTRNVRVADILNGISEAFDQTFVPINSNKDLFELAKTFIKQIRHRIELGDAYQLLTKTKNDSIVLLDETKIQIALKHWLEDLCREYGVDLNREPLTGRGPIDFKLSIGNDLKCILEIKLWDSQKLEHGLTTQLPTYLASEKALYGIYIPIAVEPKSYDSKLSSLLEKVEEQNKQKDNHLFIEVMDIKAWKQDSASKAKEPPDQSRYSW